MNKHTIIVIIASIIIVIPFAYSAWNIMTLENLELRSSQHGQFSFFEISNGRAIEICNPSPFYVSFDRLDITMFYQEDNEGTYSLPSSTIPPSSISSIEGSFRSESFSESQYTFLHMDAQFGGTVPIRLDPNQMFVVTNIQTSILGFIPYSITKQYSAFDFDNMMNEEDGKISCEN